MIYYTIKDVDGKARVILDRALEVWNNEVESPKFQFDDAHRPDSLVFKLGTKNDYDNTGYRPGKENYIEIQKDCRGDQGIYMVDILKLMGEKAGLWYG